MCEHDVVEVNWMFRANKLYYDYYSNAYYVTYDELRKCCPESEVEIFDDPPKISEAPPFIQGELIPPAGDSTNYNHHNNFGAHHNHHQSCRKKLAFCERINARLRHIAGDCYRTSQDKDNEVLKWKRQLQMCKIARAGRRLN